MNFSCIHRTLASVIFEQCTQREADDLGTLALPLNPAEERPSSGLVLGARKFVPAFYRALIEYGKLPRYRFFTAGPLVARANETIHEYAARRRAPLQSLDARPQTRLAAALTGELPSDRLLAYHEPNLSVDVMFRLRQSMARRQFPITLLNHTFSYRAMLHSTFLRLLLEDTRSYDSLICSSEAARRALQALLDHVATRFAADHGAQLSYRGRLDVIPLGVDTELWRPRDRADLRAQLGLPADATIVLYLGRLSPADKGDLLPLLDVFGRLVRELRRSDLLFVLAGTDRDGDSQPLRAHVGRSGLSRHVRFIHDPKSPHLLMGAADVFVSPADSIQEAFGLTPLEAMATGTPQVVADWDGYRDTVVDGETGFLIPTMWSECDSDLALQSPLLAREWLDHLALGQSVVIDPQLLHARLRALLTQPALRQKMGEASRRRAVERFSWPVVIARHEDLWRELSAIAAHDRREPAPQPTYNDPPYFRAFSHYATRVLSGSELLKLSARGAEIVDGEEPMPIYHASELFDEKLVDLALRTLAEAPAALRLDALEQELAERRSCTSAAARRHLLWLLKYGLLELGDDGSAR